MGKGLVAKHGAVVTSVGASGPFQDYEGGIFAGCTSDQTDHAVTVVGYGTDSATGMDYQSHISTNCPKSCGLCPGATPAASNTCYNLYSNCADLCSYGTYADKCKKACGKC